MVLFKWFSYFFSVCFLRPSNSLKYLFSPDSVFSSFLFPRPVCVCFLFYLDRVLLTDFLDSRFLLFILLLFLFATIGTWEWNLKWSDAWVLFLCLNSVTTLSRGVSTLFFFQLPENRKKCDLNRSGIWASWGLPTRVWVSGVFSLFSIHTVLLCCARISFIFLPCGSITLWLESNNYNVLFSCNILINSNNNLAKVGSF